MARFAQFAGRALRSSFFVVPALAVGAGALGACNGAPDYAAPPPATSFKTAAKKPPPISGGTLAVSADGKLAIAADSETDTLWAIDVDRAAVVSSITLDAGDEPGRAVVDAKGIAHVALRSGGAVATWNPATGDLRRDPVCGAPRGLAIDASKDVMYVACATGELVTMPASGGAPTRVDHPGLDLRDVMVDPHGEVWVSRFRSPALQLIGDGGVVASFAPAKIDVPNASFSPTVAWRTTLASNGKVYMVHQRAQTTTVQVNPPGGDGYGSGSGSTDGCTTGIVHSTVTEFDPEAQDGTVPKAFATLPGGTVPVDLAVSPSTGSSPLLAVAAAGSKDVVLTSPDFLSNGSGNCDTSAPIPFTDQPISVAFADASTLLVQTRDAPRLYIFGQGFNTGTWQIKASIDLTALDANGDPIATGDTGHDLFHLAAQQNGSIACASCHPEGREDGHVWIFDNSGARRTQNIGGDISSTAPFHWDGDMKDLGMIMDEVFVHRMGGPHQDQGGVDAIQDFVFSLPVLPPLDGASSAKVAHGAQLFHSSECATCHNGPKLTNNQTVDVGTGKPFQVPSLVGIAHRAPYLHDGCAATLADRFGPCGGGDKHGHTSQLSPSDIGDLVAYLETL